MIELNQTYQTPLGPGLVVWIVEQAGKDTEVGILMENDGQVYPIDHKILQRYQEAVI